MKKKIVVTQNDFLLISNFIHHNAHELSPYAFSRLTAELAQARVVKEDKAPTGVIRLNSEVELLETTLHKHLKVRFVLPRQADFRQHRISVFSALGIALIGYQEGDLVEWEQHGVMRKYQVLKVTHAIA